MMPFLLQTGALTANTAVSIGLMVVIIGASIGITRALTRLEERRTASDDLIAEKLGHLNEKLEMLQPLPDRIGLVERHVSNLEGDLNNLWAAYRKTVGDPDVIDRTRRERGPL